ncbi:MAG: energy transducer TonB [Desulfuromonadia bacterium]
MLGISLILHCVIIISMTGTAGRGVSFHPSPIIDLSLSDSPPSETIRSAEEPPPPADSLPPSEPVAEETRIPPQTDTTPAEQSPPLVQEPSSISFSISAGSFTSFGDGTSLRDELRPYFLDMLNRINRSWQETGKGVRLARGAMLLVSVDREGKIQGVRILQSSGNAGHDRLLISAIEKGEYPPLPDGYGKETFEAPIRFSPPLSLMSLDGLFLSPPPPH